MRPALLINGDDLIALGYKPDRNLRKFLSAVEDGQLEGRLRSREEAMAFVGSEFPSKDRSSERPTRNCTKKGAKSAFSQNLVKPPSRLRICLSL